MLRIAVQHLRGGTYSLSVSTNRIEGVLPGYQAQALAFFDHFQYPLIGSKGCNPVHLAGRAPDLVLSIFTHRIEGVLRVFMRCSSLVKTAFQYPLIGSKGCYPTFWPRARPRCPPFSIHSSDRRGATDLIRCKPLHNQPFSIHSSDRGGATLACRSPRHHSTPAFSIH